MLFEQLLVIGLLTGAVYALVGVGFTVVLGVGKVANFAHGSFVALGLYAALFAHEHLGLNPYEALVPLIVVFLLVGIAIAELFEWRGRKVGQIGELLVGLAFLLLINGALEVSFTDNPQTIEGVANSSVRLAGLNVSLAELIAAGLAVVLALSVYLLMRGTRWGRALRAVAENPEAAGLYGVRVPLAQRVAVTASIVIAGVTGIIISPFTVFTPDIGSTYLIGAFAVVVVGGIGNTLGAVPAGLIIGLAQSLSAGYLASYWTTLAPLIVILVAMLARREGEVLE